MSAHCPALAAHATYARAESAVLVRLLDDLAVYAAPRTSALTSGDDRAETVGGWELRPHRAPAADVNNPK